MVDGSHGFRRGHFGSRWPIWIS